jgi:universal stress protein E
MKRFNNILLVFNSEVKQQAAFDRAVWLARQNSARLTMMSVVKVSSSEIIQTISGLPSQELVEMVTTYHLKELNAAVKDIKRQGIDAKSIAVSGIPFLEIIRQVLRDKHDLVIIAAEGKGGLKERLFGSTSMHLMRKCPCPVWVVKPSKQTTYKKIMAAVDTTIDFPDPERQSLNPLIMQLASSLAQMDKSELHVVQVWSVFAEGYMEVRGGASEDTIRNLRKQTKREYQSRLEHLIAAVNLKGIRIRRHLPRNDDSSKTIVKLVKNYKIDLLVSGTVCRTGIAGFFIGNTAEKVLSEVNCSVLTVKPDGFVTPVNLNEE